MVISIEERISLFQHVFRKVIQHVTYKVKYKLVETFTAIVVIKIVFPGYHAVVNFAKTEFNNTILIKYKSYEKF